MSSAIKLLVLDVDGVLTDNRLHVDITGNEAKSFCIADGLGIKLWLKAGLHLAVISGHPSLQARHRLLKLGVSEVHLGVEDKLPVFEELLSRLGVNASEAAVMGDDLPDLPLLRRAGLALTVPAAHPEVLAVAHQRTTATGGNGAVREVIEKLLRSLGKYEQVTQAFRQ
jgi:3-deoxy-D-manno-octulosonate 8-phosphate phosphatase (KDO 8-P phosphatase)